MDAIVLGSASGETMQTLCVALLKVGRVNVKRLSSQAQTFLSHNQ
jgi:hypothetical protein